MFKKMMSWWKSNQEKGSERYLEREELKKELEEYSKDIKVIIESPIGKFNDKPLEKAILIHSLHTQRTLSKATNGLKTATWILAVATAMFAWVAIKDSEHSNEIMRTIQGIVGILIYFLLVVLVLKLVWETLRFILGLIKRIKINKK